VLVVKGLLFRLRRVPSRLLLDIVQALVYIAALIIALAAGGVDPLSLLTGSALLTAIIGLSLKDTLGNLLAGIAIQMQQPFSVGDWIQYDQNASHIGQVMEINWRGTRIQTLDEIEITIPHSMLGAGWIANYTRPETYSRRNIYVHAPVEAPPQTVHRIILESIADAWGVLEEPKPSVVTNAFNERGVEYWVRIFTKEFAFRDRVDGGVRDRIWYALHRNGIVIPPAVHRVSVLNLPEVEESVQRENELRQRMETLRKNFLFASASDDILQRLATLAHPQVYAAQETIARQGEHGDEIFVIRRGSVTVRIDPGNDRDTTVSRLGPGKHFGELALLAGQPRPTTVEALEECELLMLNVDDFRRVLQEHPELAERVQKAVAEHKTFIETRVQELRQRGEKSETTESSPFLQLLQRLFSLGDESS
jgi:small-conductance mechanosensitive channel/CRP-like cAMP-binding protein